MPPPQTQAGLADGARRLLDGGHAQAAGNLARKALEQDPDDPAAHGVLARLAEADQDWAAAAGHHLAVATPDALTAAARCQARAGRPSEAVAALRRAFEGHGDAARAWADRLLELAVYFESRFWRMDAADALNQALDLIAPEPARRLALLRDMTQGNPRFLAARLLFCQAITRAGDLDTAEALARALYDADPTNSVYEAALFDVLAAHHGRPYASRLAPYLTPTAPEKLRGRFCDRPFYWFELTARGDTRLCCGSYLPTSAGNVLKDGGWQAVWNSDTAQDIRRSLLDGSFKYCDRTVCRYITPLRLPDRATETDPARRRLMDEGITDIPHPTRVVLSYDPTCNLECPSCRTGLIAAKGAELDEIMAITETAVLPVLKTARVLFMSGYGDLFTSKSCRRILERVNPTDYPDLRLHLISNGNLFNERNWNAFPHIHGMTDYIQISVDAVTPDAYDELRKGGRLETVLENLRFIAGLRRAGIIQTFEISMIYQALNLDQIPAFVALGRELGCDSIVLSRLLNWGTYGSADYLARAVRPHHPDHEAYKAIINDPALMGPDLNHDFDPEFLDDPTPPATGPS